MPKKFTLISSKCFLDSKALTKKCPNILRTFEEPSAKKGFASYLIQIPQLPNSKRDCCSLVTNCVIPTNRFRKFKTTVTTYSRRVNDKSLMLNYKINIVLLTG